LNNEELNYAQRFLRIPSHPDYPSLNLAQAVAVCCYELYEAAQQAGAIAAETAAVDEAGQSSLLPFGSTSSMVSVFEPPATLDRVEGYYQQLEAMLLQIGYLYPHTASSRMEKFRRLFNRAYLTEPEVAMLRGILTQMKWALQQARLNNADSHPR
jgi:tRNA/rRNA methyltransferase